MLIPAAYSGSASQSVSSTRWSPFLDDFGWPENAICSEVNFLGIPFHTYQFNAPDATLIGYAFGGAGEIGSHFINVLSSSSEEERNEKLLRIACHLIIDATPGNGLGELLEKSTEIGEYYCSLQNCRPSLPAEIQDLGSSVVSSTFERESFSYAGD